MGVRADLLCDLITGINPGTSSIGIPATIITLPGALECTMQNLITNKVLISSMPITPEAFNFHTCRTLNPICISGANFVLGMEEYDVNGVVDGEINDASDSGEIKGLEGVLLRFEGLPLSTISVEIKYVYHFEGTPSMNLNTILTSAQEPISISDPVKFERVRSRTVMEDVIKILPAYAVSGIQGYA